MLVLRAMKNLITKHKNDFLMTCPRFSETLAQKELSSLGIHEHKAESGHVSFRTSPIGAIKAIMHSRVASRIFVKLVSFDVRDEKELYARALKVDWSFFFPLQQAFSIESKIVKHEAEVFKNLIFASQNLKDAIVDKFRSLKDGSRPDVRKENPDVHFLQVISRQGYKSDWFKVEIFLDMTGFPLHERSYKEYLGDAPLKENLAAAILLSTQWDKKEKIYDLMTGSGTLPLEAALIKGNIPPSYLKIRDFKEGKKPWAFLKHLYFTCSQKLQAQFAELFEEIQAQVAQGFEHLKNSPITIFGSDFSDKAIHIATENAQKAGLIEFMEFKKFDATIFNCGQEDVRSIIIMNPPYGKRLGEVQALEDLYFKLGENLKNNCKGQLAYIFTGNPELRKKISLQTKRKIPFMNGNIECRLLEYPLY